MFVHASFRHGSHSGWHPAPSAAAGRDTHISAGQVIHLSRANRAAGRSGTGGGRKSKVIVEAIPRLDELLGHTHALRARYVGYSVRADDYKTVGAALMAAIAAVLGDGFVEATWEAWSIAYNFCRRDHARRSRVGEAHRQLCRGRAGQSPRPFPADLPQVGEEVNLDGVLSGWPVSPGGRLEVAGDLAVHLRLRGQARAALQEVSYPLRLGLGDRHDRPDRLDEPDVIEPGQGRRNDAAVEADDMVGSDQVLI